MQPSRIIAFALSLSACGCGGSTDDARLTALEDRVAVLQDQLAARSVLDEFAAKSVSFEAADVGTLFVTRLVVLDDDRQPRIVIDADDLQSGGRLIPDHGIYITTNSLRSQIDLLNTNKQLGVRLTADQTSGVAYVRPETTTTQEGSSRTLRP